MHEHSRDCKHELKFCEHCNVVYCVKCKTEWKPPCTLNHYPYYNVWGTIPCPTPSITPYTTPWTLDTNSTSGLEFTPSEIVICNHGA